MTDRLDVLPERIEPEVDGRSDRYKWVALSNTSVCSG
jgi:hypothetical protein